MKSRNLSLLFFTLLCALLCLLASCGGTETDAPGTAETGDLTSGGEADTAAAPADPFRLTEGGKVVCRVIRSIDANDTEVNRAMEVRDALRKKLGADVQLGNDFAMNGKHNHDTYEILVGNTTYEESADLQKELLYGDAVVKIVGHKILILGNSADAARKAINWFVNKALPEMKTGENGDLTLSFEPYEYRAEYPLAGLCVNGTPISEFSIVYPASGSCFEQKEADRIPQLLAAATGRTLTCTTDAGSRSEHEILLGRTRHSDAAAASSAPWSVSVSGGDLIVGCTGICSAECAVEKLLAELKASGKTDIPADYSLSGDWMEEEAPARAEGTDLRIMSWNVLTQKYNAVDYTASRAEIAGRLLEEYAPDAAGLQEVCSYWRQYFAVCGGKYKMICTHRPDGVENYSVIIYDSEKYDVVDSGVIPYNVSSNKQCRNMGWAILRSKTTGFTFGLVSTHWDFNTETTDGDAIRRAQADMASAQIAAMAAKYACPVFHTGDHNCGQNSASMTYFRSVNNMWCNKFDSQKYLNNYASSGGMNRIPTVGGNVIDYVFGTKDTECLSTMVVINCRAGEVSDHRPVIADIRVKK